MTTQRGLFDDGIGGPGLGGPVLTGPGLDVTVHRSLFEAADADGLFAALRHGIDWQQDDIVVFGRRSPVPRLTAWYGDAGVAYTYSGIRMEARPWIEELRVIRGRVAAAAAPAGHTAPDQAFNSVLANLYRTGADGVAWHADDEVELGRHPVIASVSLGATRSFQFRRRDDAAIRRSIDLHHGDVIVMRGTTQQLWHHQIPKAARPVGERINLTFRRVLVAAH